MSLIKLISKIKRKLFMSNVNELKVTRIRGVKLPERATPGSCGLDIFCPYDLTRIDLNKMIEMTKVDVRVDTNASTGTVTNIVIRPHQSVLIPTGLKIRVPDGCCIKVENKSSVATLKELVVGATLIDFDFTGEILVNLHNVSENKMAVICPGDKIAQLVVYPVEMPKVVEIETPVELFKNMNSERLGGCFGSTGS